MFISKLESSHHKIVGGGLALYGGYYLYYDFQNASSVNWYDWAGDTLVFLVGVGMLF